MEVQINQIRDINGKGTHDMYVDQLPLTRDMVSLRTGFESLGMDTVYVYVMETRLLMCTTLGTQHKRQ